MKKRYLPITLICLYLVYGIYISQYEVAVRSPQLRRENSTGYYDYKGTTHIDADLTATSAAASALGYDFLALSNLNRFDENQQTPFYSHRTLVMPSYKISFLDSRLVLWDNKNLPLFDGLGEAQTFLTDLFSRRDPNLLSRLLILAHPLRPGFQWTGELPPAVQGIEIINMRSMFEQAWRGSKLFCIWSLLIYPFNSRLAVTRLFDDPTKETRLLDDLSRDRKILIFGAQDDIAAPVKWLFREMHILSVKSALDFMSTHIWLKSELTGDPQNDSDKVMAALRAGNSYLAIDALGDPSGFFVELSDEKKRHLTGVDVSWNANLKLDIQIPTGIKVPVEVAVFKDGFHFMSSDSTQTEIPLPGSGVYRVVVYVKPEFPLPDTWRWVPWIFTNPSYVH
jgi:hypothetical protein